MVLPMIWRIVIKFPNERWPDCAPVTLVNPEPYWNEADAWLAIHRSESKLVRDLAVVEGVR